MGVQETLICQERFVKPIQADLTTKGEKLMSRHEQLEQVAKDLRENVPDIQGVMVASNEGLSIATDMHEDEAVKVAAVCAAAAGLGSRIVTNASLGEAEEVMVKGRDGLLMIYLAGAKGVLAVRAPARGNLGLVRLEASAAAADIRRILG
jgi:hypothetical protein